MVMHTVNKIIFVNRLKKKYLFLEELGQCLLWKILE